MRAGSRERDSLTRCDLAQVSGFKRLLQYTKALLRLRYLLLLFIITIFFLLYEDTVTTSSFQ